MSTNMIKSLTTADGPRLENSVTLVSEAPGTPPTIVDWQHRFKVVKMVSKEPFKRGRWLCMDFNDPPPSDVPGVSNIAELASDRPLSYFERDSSVGQSGGSTVAIDNKIEQAMDLVKSHLMFAVREEVDVLKEKIEELMEKITQLEYENSVLRAHASPETLSLLQQPAQQQAASAPQPPQSQATPQAQPPQLSNPQSSQPQSQPLLILETSNNNGNNAQE